MVSRAPRALQIQLASALVVLGFGAWLRALAQPWHTNLWTIDWLSYYEAQADALSSFRLHAWIGSWEGLHPPVSGALHGAIMVFGGSLATHWAATVAAGLLAAVFLARPFVGPGRVRASFGLLLLLWVALSPLQANYGLNTSPYPWVLLLCGAATVALLRAAQADTPSAWVLAGVVMGLAVQTHVLAFVVALGQLLWILGRGRPFLRTHRAGLLRWGLVLGVLAAPMIVGSLTATGDPWTFHIEPGEQSWWSTALMVVFERFGDRPSGHALGLVLGVGGLGGLALAPRGLPGLLGVCILGWLAALALFFVGHVADPRLSHYYLVPHMFGLALGAVGWAEIADRAAGRGRPRIAAGILAAVLAVTGWWAVESIGWQLARRDRAHRLVSEAGAAPEAVRALFLNAGPGDVVAYLWDHQFLNDEPEYLDPIAARWPITRLGRPCPEEHPPRGLCNAFGSARFYFDPSAFAGDLWELEEPLRLMVNRAEAPGSTRIVLLEGPERPPHPWPTEVWMREHGGTSRSLGGNALVWEFPPGARIDPPAHPLGPPGEEAEPSP